MKAKTFCGTAGRLGLIAAVALAGGASAETFKWAKTEYGNTPATAYDWSDASNWTNNAVPSAGAAVEFPNLSGVYYVRMPDEVQLGSMMVNANVRLIGGTVTVTDLGTGRRAQLEGDGVIYADIVYNQPGDVCTTHYLASINLAGRTIAQHGEVVSAWGVTRHRLDLYATSSDPLRTDDFQMTKTMHPGSGSVYFYAPEGADACTSTWSQTAGSPFLSRVSATAHTIAVGTIVTGAGIPEGTFVKRRYTASEIELSAPVTETAAANEVTFAAFTPDVRAHIPTFSRQGMLATDFKLYKRRAQDGFRFEMDNYYTGGSQINQHGLGTGEVSSYQPGTHVFHHLAGSGTRSFKLLNCDIEFAGAPNASGMSLPASSPMCFGADANYTARLTVTNGLVYSAEVFTNWVGTLVKAGAGTLELGLGDRDNTGALVLEGGTLALTRNTTVGDARIRLAKASIAAGATLQVPESGLEIGSFTAEEGAVLSGPGEVVVVLEPGKNFVSGGLVLTNGATIRVSGGVPGARITEKPEGRVAGHPAFWLDASRPESIEYTTEEGVNYVTRWNDWREGEPMFCTNIIHRPTFINGDLMTNKYVRLKTHSESEFYTNTEQLVWSVPIKDIRAVFLVQDPTEGGGELLGRCSWRLNDSYYGSRGGPFYRGGSTNWKTPLISSAYTTYCVSNGWFFLNGQNVIGCRTSYLGPFMQLVECHINTDWRASTSHKELWCDAFGGGYLDNPGGGRYVYNSNGGMRIAEYIIYTNTLTHVERVQTAQYLMKKWLNADVAYEEWDIVGQSKPSRVSAAGEQLDVADGSVCFAGEVSGTGALVKTGDGTLYVKNLPSGGIDVQAGDVVVDSLSLKNTSVPAGSWLHVDAADLSSFETSGAGAVTNVVKWKDVDGSGVSLQRHSSVSANYAQLVPNALNGLPVVDLGVLNGSNKAALRYYKADGSTYTHDNDGSHYYIANAPLLKTMFFVYGAKGGGNSLLGCWFNGYPAQGFAHKTTDRTKPMFYEEGYWNMAFKEGGMSTAISNGTCVVHLDGERVDPFTTPYSKGGENDYSLFSFNWSSGRVSDTFGTYGQESAFVGGVEYGEIILYTNQLSAADFAHVEVYLQKKWFNRDTDGYRMAEPTAFTVAAGASASIRNGELRTDLLGGGGTVNGDVAVNAGGALGAVIQDDGTVGTLTVDGDVDLSKGGAVRLVGDVSKLRAGHYDLIVSDAIEAAKTGTWTPEVRKANGLLLTVRVEDGAVELIASPAGTTFIFR